jgi:hypothetical protein
MTLRVRRRSPQERSLIAQRMTPGAAGGRSALVAPQPKDPPRLDTLAPEYTALLPWGYAGDPVSDYNLTGWKGVYRTAAAAESPDDEPVVLFGTGADGGSRGGMAFLRDANSGKSGGYLEMLLGDADSRFEMSPASGELWSTEVVSGTVELRARDHEGYLKLNSGDAYFEASAGDPTSGHYGDGYAVLQNSAAYIGMFVNGDATQGEAFIAAKECQSTPSAPAANHAKLFVRDNGAGKSQWVALFPSGAAQVIVTEP